MFAKIVLCLGLATLAIILNPDSSRKGIRPCLCDLIWALVALELAEIVLGIYGQA